MKKLLLVFLVVSHSSQHHSTKYLRSPIRSHALVRIGGALASPRDQQCRAGCGETLHRQ